LGPRGRFVNNLARDLRMFGRAEAGCHFEQWRCAEGIRRAGRRGRRCESARQPAGDALPAQIRLGRRAPPGRGPVVAARAEIAIQPSGWPGAPRALLASPRRRTADRRGSVRAAAQRRARSPLWQRALAEESLCQARPGEHSSPPRPAAERQTMKPDPVFAGQPWSASRGCWQGTGAGPFMVLFQVRPAIDGGMIFSSWIYPRFPFPPPP